MPPRYLSAIPSAPDPQRFDDLESATRFLQLPAEATRVDTRIHALAWAAHYFLEDIETGNIEQPSEFTRAYWLHGLLDDMWHMLNDAFPTDLTAFSVPAQKALVQLRYRLDASYPLLCRILGHLTHEASTLDDDHPINQPDALHHIDLGRHVVVLLDHTTRLTRSLTDFYADPVSDRDPLEADALLQLFFELKDDVESAQARAEAILPFLPTTRAEVMGPLLRELEFQTTRLQRCARFQAWTIEL